MGKDWIAERLDGVDLWFVVIFILHPCFFSSLLR